MVRSESYSVLEYAKMIGNRERTDAYAEALRKSIRPGSVVIDIGSGTGIFAMLACRYGAKRVYAIEPNSAIRIASQLVSTNGLSDRVEFIQNLSTRVDIPEKADVIVSDLRGTLPLNFGSLATLIDARHRFLAPDGIMIPFSDVVWMAAVNMPEENYANYANPWNDNDYGFNMQPIKRVTLNAWGSEPVAPEHIVLPAQVVASLDYMTITNTDLDGEVTWEVDQPAKINGLAVWFEAKLYNNISYISCSPGHTDSLYGIGFMPLLDPISLEVGDTIGVSLQAHQIGNFHYTWHWQTRVKDKNNIEKPRIEYRQSTLNDIELYFPTVGKQNFNYRPKISTAGKIEKYVLDNMNGVHTVQEIAELISKQFPEYFPDVRAAKRFVGLLSTQYG